MNMTDHVKLVKGEMFRDFVVRKAEEAAERWKASTNIMLCI